MLLQRYKNRLKGMDDVVRRVAEAKVDRAEFERLEHSMAKGRADSVFEDMKILLESTV